MMRRNDLKTWHAKAKAVQFGFVWFTPWQPRLSFATRLSWSRSCCNFLVVSPGSMAQKRLLTVQKMYVCKNFFPLHLFLLYLFSPHLVSSHSTISRKNYSDPSQLWIFFLKLSSYVDLDFLINCWQGIHLYNFKKSLI